MIAYRRWYEDESYGLRVWQCECWHLLREWKSPYLAHTQVPLQRFEFAMLAGIGPTTDPNPEGCVSLHFAETRNVSISVEDARKLYENLGRILDDRDEE